MRKGLWKIADLTARRGVIFFRQQADVIGQRQQPDEQFARVVDPALHHVIVDQPEGAGQERALARRQAVDAFGRVITQHQAVFQQAALDLGERAAHPGIVGRQEPDQRNLQQARVERPGAIGLHETVAFGVIGFAADFVVNLVADRAPALDGSIEVQFLRRAHDAVEGDPGHHLRMGEMFQAAAHFPDAIVRLAPDGFEMVDHRLAERPALVHGRQSGLAPDDKRRRPPRHRRRAAIARPRRCRCAPATNFRSREARWLHIRAGAAPPRSRT